ncbi:hypothetical protein GCM10010472_71310 [Pseudonocardia halophobica]|uniref:Tetratricopeptide repeat protein n=1 Tax=Pseudonocardia halophobica TaxID=29401 RepID=A0A9W6KZG7_9PSEU|nr:hypothetical protein GCM10017577_21380 [Pseudonocardia halophobica]
MHERKQEPDQWCRCLLCRIGDEEAVAVLRGCGASGPGWDGVAEHLARYALATMHQQFLRHTLVTEANVHRRRAGLHPLWLTPEDGEMLRTDGAQRSELFDATVAHALARFKRHDVVGGRWRPGGRAVPGYLVTRCYFVLGEQLTAWRPGRDRAALTLAAEVQKAREQARLAEVDLVDALRDQPTGRLDPLLRTMPDTLRAAVDHRLAHDGAGWADAARALQVSPKVSSAPSSRCQRDDGLGVRPGRRVPACQLREPVVQLDHRGAVGRLTTVEQPHPHERVERLGVLGYDSGGQGLVRVEPGEHPEQALGPVPEFARHRVEADLEGGRDGVAARQCTRVQVREHLLQPRGATRRRGLPGTPQGQRQAPEQRGQPLRRLRPTAAGGRGKPVEDDPRPRLRVEPPHTMDDGGPERLGPHSRVDGPQGEVEPAGGRAEEAGDPAQPVADVVEVVGGHADRAVAPAEVCGHRAGRGRLAEPRLPDQHERRPAERPCLRDQYLLGWVLAEQRELDAAARRLIGVLVERTELLGPLHRETLATRHRLAWVTGMAGNPVEAEEELRALVRLREELHGTRAHLDVHNSRYRLGCLLAQDAFGKEGLDEARELFASLCEELEPLGATHSMTLMVRVRQAWVAMRQLRFDDAVDAYSDLLADQEKVLGVDHARTLRTRHTLARLTLALGDARKAEEDLRGWCGVGGRCWGPAIRTRWIAVPTGRGRCCAAGGCRRQTGSCRRCWPIDGGCWATITWLP